jgi:hypothetical protein
MEVDMDSTKVGPYDIDAELQTMLGPNPHVIELPQNIQGVIRLLLEYRKSVIQIMTVRLRRNPPDKVTDAQYGQLAAFLSTMHNLEFIDPQMK